MIIEEIRKSMISDSETKSGTTVDGGTIIMGDLKHVMTNGFTKFSSLFDPLTIRTR